MKQFFKILGLTNKFFRWLSSQNLQHFLIEFLEEVLQQNKERNQDGRHRIQETGALSQKRREGKSPGDKDVAGLGNMGSGSQETLTSMSPGRECQCSRIASGSVSSQENKNSFRYSRQRGVCNQGIALKSIESNLGFLVWHIRSLEVITSIFTTRKKLNWKINNS